MSGLLSIGSRAASVRRHRQHSHSAHNSPTHTAARNSPTYLSPSKGLQQCPRSAPATPAHSSSSKSFAFTPRPEQLGFLAPPKPLYQAGHQGHKSAPVSPLTYTPELPAAAAAAAAAFQGRTSLQSSPQGQPQHQQQPPEEQLNPSLESTTSTPLNPATLSSRPSYSTFDSLPWGLEHVHHQVSVDDRRQLFSAGKLNTDASMSAYGSIVYQMKDANMESNNTCEFVYKALKVLSRTVLMTVILLIIMIVPVLMAIMGVQYLNECPLEPKIPIYLLVGGCFGTLKGLWLLCQQVRSRRYERIDDAFAEDGLDEIFTSTSYRATDVALTIFLVIWFGMGNYWVYRIYLPNFQVTLFKPNDWCSKTVYLFSVAQLIFVYVVLAVVLLTIICLACGQKCATLFDESYK
ncbi:uncharacterized protein LOC135212693 isoform X1 [Macrobrachium nipponense]|uniref:uncharacterized protein LOC135212693 isoform X1 n=1 Tax=Macrobrachium nipponense TaxID=159736 RepID=UPI0030C86CBC